jgi:hypothetical protein
MAVWSEVKWSALTHDRRVDAEYYQPKYLEQEGAIESMPHDRLDAVADVSDGNHLSIAEDFAEEGVRYLRGKDLSDFFVSDADPAFIPEATYDTLKRSHMFAGDVLLGVVATIGTVSLVTDRFDRLTGNCKIAIVRPKSLPGEYLAAFFASPVGQRELHRRARGTVQTGVILPDLKSMPIPRLDARQRQAIVDRVKAAHDARQQSVDLYAEAEALLESALGLDRLDLTPRLFYERPFADVRDAGRVDAEYFQPRMQNLMGALSRDGKTINDVARLSKRRFKPSPGVEFEYIEIGDVGTSGSADSSTVAGEDAASRATWIVRPGDVITTTVRPIRRLSAIVTPEQSGAVASSGFAVLTSRENEAVPPELLLAYLRLPLVCELLDLHTTASMYPAISTDDLMRIPITLPGKKDRAAVVDRVRQSFQARRNAKAMLEEAKSMVEKAVLGDAAASVAAS